MLHPLKHHNQIHISNPIVMLTPKNKLNIMLQKNPLIMQDIQLPQDAPTSDSPDAKKNFSIARRTYFRIQHINPKLVLHIHVFQFFNLHTLFLFFLHIHHRCSICLLSMLISNLLKIYQLNSDGNTQVPPTKLFILQRNQGKLPSTFLNSIHILNTIIHNPAIILQRSTK